MTQINGDVEYPPPTQEEIEMRVLRHKAAFYDAVQFRYPGITAQGVINSLDETITKWPSRDRILAMSDNI